MSMLPDTLGTLFDMSHDPVLGIDGRKVIVYANPAAAALLGGGARPGIAGRVAGALRVGLAVRGAGVLPAPPRNRSGGRPAAAWVAVHGRASFF